VVVVPLQGVHIIGGPGVDLSNAVVDQVYYDLPSGLPLAAWNRLGISDPSPKGEEFTDPLWGTVRILRHFYEVAR